MRKDREKTATRYALDVLLELRCDANLGRVENMEQIVRMLAQVEAGVKVIAVCVVIMAVLAIIRTINSFFT